MITDVQLTDAGAERFTAWVKEVGRDHLILDGVIQEAMGSFLEDVQCGDDPHYELGTFDTWRKQAALFFPEPGELVITEAPDDD